MSHSQLALIGDVHAYWTDFDLQYFNHSNYDALLFTGDLPRFVGGKKDARALSGLSKPTILVPGNHDGSTLQQFSAELKNWEGLCERTARGQVNRMQAYEQALGPVQLGGYSLHSLTLGNRQVDVLVGRPHSMGGDRLYFAPYLRERFGIENLEQSEQRLKELVDKAADELLFLAHNGPAGLGEQPDSIWGCDFNPELGDFGDTDWRAAIDYACSQGKRVWAVVGGHMHHHVKRQGGERCWHVEQAGVHYLNAARVPRIFKHEGGLRHHHLCLTLSEERVDCQAVWVSPDGHREIRQPYQPKPR